MIGALLSGWFADRIGRKRSLLLNNIIALIGGAFIVSAKPVGVYYLFTVGRLINGINTGFLKKMPVILNYACLSKVWADASLHFIWQRLRRALFVARLEVSINFKSQWPLLLPKSSGCRHYLAPPSAGPSSLLSHLCPSLSSCSRCLSVPNHRNSLW